MDKHKWRQAALHIKKYFPDGFAFSAVHACHGACGQWSLILDGEPIVQRQMSGTKST